ncbi:hypothetical protein [Streptomyces fumanus]|uniref:hypothetical protein n=1 Tax=Streptomyces fumanus TaxID=67302 RepID=UPI0033C8C1A0
MESPELIVAVAAAVLGAGWLARRTVLSEPLLLLGAGCLMGLTPPFDDNTLAPEAVLLLFLPAPLYWEALTSSVRCRSPRTRSVIGQPHTPRDPLAGERSGDVDLAALPEEAAASRDRRGVSG